MLISSWHDQGYQAVRRESDAGSRFVECLGLALEVPAEVLASIPWNRGDLGCSDVEWFADLVERVCGGGQAGPARVSCLQGSQRLGGQGHAEGVSRSGAMRGTLEA